MVFLKRFLSPVVTFSFIAIFIVQSLPLYAAQSNLLNLPEPGKMISLSPKFVPAHVKGISIYPNDPFKFDFIIDTGDTKLNDQQFKDESNRLIKYFMAALTVPENEDWVNLSPYEKDRIVPESLGVTEMGRDMLAQDYILKQLTSSLIYPEKELGKEFWSKVYALAQEKFGTTEIPMSTFNKVWIVPSEAVVWEHDNSAYVVRSHLKVMLEQDYLSLNKHLNNNIFSGSHMDKQDAKTANAVASNVVRELVLPALEKEVNEGANFATVRQVFNSAILAAWYKQNLKQTILGQVYANKNKVIGVDLADKQIKQKIYERYLSAFKKGAFNFIKEDDDPATHQIIPRKYFSGGVTNMAMVTQILQGPLPQEYQTGIAQEGEIAVVTAGMVGAEPVAGANRAMITPAELKEANDRTDQFIQQANIQIALELTRAGLRGAYQPVERILGKETEKDSNGKKVWKLTEAQLQALIDYYRPLEATFRHRFNNGDDYLSKAVDLLVSKQKGGNLKLTEKEQNGILRGSIKKTADDVAADTRQALRNKFGVISIARFIEGISDGVLRAGQAGKKEIPTDLESMRAEIENAIQVAIKHRLDMKIFRVGETFFPIIEEGRDDLEGTDAFVDNPDNPPEWFSGSTSISAYGLGVGSLSGLGYIPDEAYAGQFLANMGNAKEAKEFREITVEERNLDGVMEAFHLYDPELYALNPDRFIEVLKFKARKKFGDDSPENLAKLKVAVTVMDRPTERAFIKALNKIRESGVVPGLRVVLIKAGSVAHGKKAVMTPEQFEAKYKKPYGDEDVIMQSRVGPVEAALNMVDARKFEETGAIGAMRIFSGDMQVNPAGGDMQNQDRRYSWSDGTEDPADNEVKIITALRQETGDTEEILKHRKVFTTTDIPGHVKTSATVIVASPFLGQPGVTQRPDDERFVVKLITASSTAKGKLRFLVIDHVANAAQLAQKAPATRDWAALAQNSWRRGGINLDPNLYNMQVQRDGKGIVLPISQQPIGQFMKIKGFKPVFLNIEHNINLSARLEK